MGPPPPPTDPIGFTFKSTAGSFASFGWTGAVHDVVEPVDTPFSVEVTQCSAGVCRFQGPTDSSVSSVNRRRCLLQMSKTCTTDSDCLVDGKDLKPCVYIYDTPISTGLRGGNPTTGPQIGACGWSYIPLATEDGEPTITGTLNLTSGALNLENLTIFLPLNSRGDGTFAGACAECIGDRTANDGVKDGRCMPTTHLGDGKSTATPIADPDKPDIGKPCDVNRSGTLTGYEGSYSMDCSPTLPPGLSPPLQFGGSFISSGFQVSIKKDQSPACTSGGNCFCGMCPDGLTACMSNQDCGGKQCSNPSTLECDPNPPPPDPGFAPMLQINQCKKLSSDPTKFLVAGDECEGPCQWDDASAQGRCTSKLPDPSNPSKRLVLGCYPSGPGATIMAPGRQDHVDHVGTVYFADTAGARCIAAGQSVQLNSQLGLPGLLFQKRNFQIIPEYAEDPK